MAGMRYQPQGRIRLDPSHPLVRDLVFVAVPGGPELLSGVLPVAIGAAAISSTEQGKTFYSSSNTTDGWYWPVAVDHPIYSITNEDTLLILANRISGASFGNMFGVPYRSGSWATPFYAWGLGSQSNTTVGNYSFATSTSARSSAVTSAGFYVNGVMQAYGVTRSAGRVRYYSGPSQFGSDASYSSANVDWANRQPPVLFNRSSSSLGEGMRGHAVLILVWRRELSADEWISISGNPWQLFLSPNTDEDDPPPTPSVYTLTAAAGAFAVAGSPAGLRAARRLAAVPAAFSLVAAAAALRAARRLPLEPGAFALTGSAAGLRATRKFAADSGVFSLTGGVATLVAARRLSAATGSFAVVGQAATLVHTAAPALEGPTYVLTALSGSFALSAAPAALVASRRLAASTGEFGIAAAPVGVTASRRLGAAPGAFGVSGAAAALQVARCLPAATGAFMITGVDVALRYSAQIEYARAPAGPGYTPRRQEYQSRPAQVGGIRPSATEKAYR